MPDERLHVLPVQDGVLAQVGPAAAWHQPAKHRPRTAVDTEEPPTVVDVPKHEVMRLDDAAAGHVHQVASEDVAGQQHLARPPLECAHVKRAAVEPHLSRSEPVHDLATDEQIAPADADLDPGHWWVA